MNCWLSGIVESVLIWKLQIWSVAENINRSDAFDDACNEGFANRKVSLLAPILKLGIAIADSVGERHKTSTNHNALFFPDQIINTTLADRP